MRTTDSTSTDETRVRAEWWSFFALLLVFFIQSDLNDVTQFDATGSEGRRISATRVKARSWGHVLLLVEFVYMLLITSSSSSHLGNGEKKNLIESDRQWSTHSQCAIEGKSIDFFTHTTSAWVRSGREGWRLGWRFSSFLFRKKCWSGRVMCKTWRNFPFLKCANIGQSIQNPAKKPPIPRVYMWVKLCTQMNRTESDKRFDSNTMHAHMRANKINFTIWGKCYYHLNN